MESEIKKAICDYLDQKGIAYLRLNSGVWFVSGRGGRKYKIQGCKNGTADIEVLAPLVPIFVEFKTKGGKQTKEQKDFESMVLGLGYHYVLIDNIENGIAMVDSIKKGSVKHGK